MAYDAAAQPQRIERSLLAHDRKELLTAGSNSLAAGAGADAQALFHAVALRHPRDPECRYRLASALLSQGRVAEAELALSDARDLHARAILQQHAPHLYVDDGELDHLTEVAGVFYGNGQMAVATHLLQRVLAAGGGDDPQVWVSLGLSLMHQGRAEEAIATFEGAVWRWPASAALHSFLHYARMFRQESGAVLHEEGLRWARAHAAPATKALGRAPQVEGGRIKVGYVSPTFNRHQLTKFFLPVMEHHDPARVRIICYSGAPAEDEVGAEVQARADLWRDASAMDDATLVAQIVADGVDVLVDLWGHTAGGRLTAFARKPAPIQVSWLNYIETTGLSEFDYVLHADNYNLPGAQALFTETIRPVGPVLAPFRPFEDVGPSGETPALASGAVTFGAFVHPGKLTLEVIETWARILSAAPGSTLTLRYSYFKDPTLRRALGAMFEAYGIAAERLVFPPHATGGAFQRAYHEIDLALDTFPYQGMTTTLDALHAGVPVLAYEGSRMNERTAATTLRACGLGELVAENLDAYVDAAVSLARDLPRLNAIRSRVRSGFEASPYRDEAGFVRRLEETYADMIAEWRAGQVGAATA